MLINICLDQLRGKLGELYAANYLALNGYTILKKNWRCLAGEVDIVVYKNSAITIVEVKTRTPRSYNFLHPLHSINQKKFDRLNYCAKLFATKYFSYLKYPKISIDLIAVKIHPLYFIPLKVEHYSDFVL